MQVAAFTKTPANSDTKRQYHKFDWPAVIATQNANGDQPVRLDSGQDFVVSVGALREQATRYAKSNRLTLEYERGDTYLIVRFTPKPVDGAANGAGTEPVQG